MTFEFPHDQQWPMPIDMLDHVEDAHMGMKIPLHIESTDFQRHCRNCGNPDGRLYFFEVGDGGAIKWITDKYGNTKKMYGHTKSVPCPVCRPLEPSPIFDELEDEYEGESWTV